MRVCRSKRIAGPDEYSDRSALTGIVPPALALVFVTIVAKTHWCLSPGHPEEATPDSGSFLFVLTKPEITLRFPRQNQVAPLPEKRVLKASASHTSLSFFLKKPFRAERPQPSGNRSVAPSSHTMNRSLASQDEPNQPRIASSRTTPRRSRRSMSTASSGESVADWAMSAECSCAKVFACFFTSSIRCTM